MLYVSERNFRLESRKISPKGLYRNDNMRQLKKNNSGAVDGKICKINAVTLRYDIVKNPISRSVSRSKSQTGGI